MILEFSITNFRSIREKQTFSMHASSARSKGDNIFEHQLANGETVNLTKAAVIYGANASGKSNVVLALLKFQELVTNAKGKKIDDAINAYQPFLFDNFSKNAPSEFEILFAAKNNQKYRYLIVFNQNEIIKEELQGFPKKKAQQLFTRPFAIDEQDLNLHTGRLGKELGYKKYNVHKKLPLLSIFGNLESYHKEISIVYTYFKDLFIEDADLLRPMFKMVHYIDKNVEREKLERLLYALDTQIRSLKTEPTFDKNGRRLADDKIFAQHDVYENGVKNGYHDLPFKEESLGTRHLLGLAQLVLEALDFGLVLVFDELDSSLHPFISRFLVKLFLNPISNPKNAQLIFTTHEPSILDKELLRADQIWFTEKTPEGTTELFSAQDFDGVREDVPFDKWYMAGKFGAVPHISTIEYIFGNGEETND